MEKSLEEVSRKRAGWQCILVAFWLLVFSVVFVASSFCGGCCNVNERFVSDSSPIWCSRHPYYSTSRVWEDCILAPSYIYYSKPMSGYEAIRYASATGAWPFWVVDELFEVVFDTVFLPVDATYLCCKGNGEREESKRWK